MSIVSDIISNTGVMSKKKPLSILQSFVKEHYVNADHQMRNTVGEYSPEQILRDYRKLLVYLKGLTARKGLALTFNYSYLKLQNIRTYTKTLADLISTINDSTGTTTLRNTLSSIARGLEGIKDALGPFVEAKIPDAPEALLEKLEGYQQQLQDIEETRNEINKMASDIKAQFSLSEKTLEQSKEAQKTLKQYSAQASLQNKAINEIYEKLQNYARTAQRNEKTAVERFEALEQRNQEVERLTDVFDDLHKKTRARHEELLLTLDNIKNSQDQIRKLENQSRHLLTSTQGRTLVHTYEDLYRQEKRLIKKIPWILAISLGFVLTSICSYVTYSVLSRIGTGAELLPLIKESPLLTFILTGIASIVVFLFGLHRLRKQSLKTAFYRARVTSLDSYLKIADTIPSDSPEYLAASKHILGCIEEDFSILSPYAEATEIL